MNRRDASVDDFAPDAFLGANQVALAVGRAALDEMIQRAMNEQFPGVNTEDGSEVTTDEGTATLYTLSVTPSDPGSHDQAEGHLWSEGFAEVHIDCWPDPDVTFSGPIFLRVGADRDRRGMHDARRARDGRVRRRPELLRRLHRHPDPGGRHRHADRRRDR